MFSKVSMLLAQSLLRVLLMVVMWQRTELHKTHILQMQHFILLKHLLIMDL